MSARQKKGASPAAQLALSSGATQATVDELLYKVDVVNGAAAADEVHRIAVELLELELAHLTARVATVTKLMEWHRRGQTDERCTAAEGVEAVHGMLQSLRGSPALALLANVGLVDRSLAQHEKQGGSIHSGFMDDDLAESLSGAPLEAVPHGFTTKLHHEAAK